MSMSVSSEGTIYKDIALDSNCVIELANILTNNKTMEYIQPSSSSLFPHS